VKLKPREITVCRNCYDALTPFPSDLIQKFTEKIPEVYFNKLIILFDYSELLQQLMHYFKYEGYIEIANYFAESFHFKIQIKYDFICYVPLHNTKQRERGYNQSEVIASKLASLTHHTVMHSTLSRIAYTKSQTKLSRLERAENVKDAFKVNEDVKNKTILLFDDVITTGTTINTCAKVLKEAGAKIVDAAAVATPVDILKQIV
jgi:ComF family protein